MITDSLVYKKPVEKKSKNNEFVIKYNDSVINFNNDIFIRGIFIRGLLPNISGKSSGEKVKNTLIFATRFLLLLRDLLKSYIYIYIYICAGDLLKSVASYDLSLFISIYILKYIHMYIHIYIYMRITLFIKADIIMATKIKSMGQQVFLQIIQLHLHFFFIVRVADLVISILIGTPRTFIY